MTTITAERMAQDLTDPGDVQDRYRPPAWWAQSLANGALGIALLHVERARTDRGSWHTAHTWLTHVTTGAIDDGPHSNLDYGAPALAYVLHHASTDHPTRYARALDHLDTRITALTHIRVDAAHRRIDAGHTPTLSEFDTLRGLTGLGAYWLRHQPDGPPLRRILDYLVRLTEPLPARAGHDQQRPGWWTHLAPNGRRTPEFPDGHANHGLAHGIAGPLALLALAARAGHIVPGHHNAIERILAWYDTHRRHHDHHTWWPYWTTTHDSAQTDLRAGRPSWCYGSPGIARAHQLAGLARNDPDRISTAEAVLLAAVTAPDLTTRLNDRGLCHGLAGALLITRRAAADSTDHRLRDHANHLRTLLDTSPTDSNEHAVGLLDGPAGTALAAHDHTLAGSGWDACLLTS